MCGAGNAKKCITHILYSEHSGRPANDKEILVTLAPAVADIYSVSPATVGYGSYFMSVSATRLYMLKQSIELSVFFAAQ